MKNMNLRRRKLQVVKESQKISGFFNKPSNNPSSQLTKSNLKPSDEEKASDAITSRTLVDSDDDIIPCTPNVGLIRKYSSVAKTNRNSCTDETILKEIINIGDINESKKRKKSNDETDVNYSKRQNLLIGVINTSSVGENSQNTAGSSCNSCCNDESKTVTLDDKIAYIPEVLSLHQSPQINKFRKTNTKQQLFQNLPNTDDVKAKNFNKITPSKSRTIISSNSVKQKQISILEYFPLSNSNQSGEVQKRNRIETSFRNVMPSTSTATMELNLSLDAPISDINHISDETKDPLNTTILQDFCTFEDSWENFTIYEDYSLDLHELQLCIVTEIVRNSTYLNLVLQSTKSKEKAKCTMEGFWLHSKFNTGCTVYVCAIKKDVDWTINNEHGLLIYEPDILVSSTSIVGAIFCKRQSIFKERFSGFGLGNKAMVIGILVHTLLQHVLKCKITTYENTEQVLEEILASRSSVNLMYTNSVTLESIKVELSTFIPRVVAFMNCYIVNDKTSTVNSENWHGNIDSLLDIEENIWCRELGIKGKIDVTVKCGDNVVPLELKTGRASFSLEHRGQVILYIMMMSKLGYNASSGLLLYLRDGILKEISNNTQEKRDLILLRNELTYYLTRKTEIIQIENDSDNKVNTTLKLPELPEPISHHSACARCPYNTICCAYLRYEGVDLSHNKHLQLVRDEVLVHLTDAHIQYFIHWNNLLDLESTKTHGKDIKSIYTQTSAEREKYGKCITSVKVMNRVMECDGFYSHTFQKIDTTNTVSFMTSGIGKSNYVIVSTDTRPAVATGMVIDLDHQYITIALDRDLSLKYADMIFHLDSYDSTSAHALDFTNLAMLLEPTTQADRLRHLIIDKDVPTYETKFSKFIAVKAAPILRDLNKMQKKAVLKSLVANDYLLIKGMPGTGKTATIVALVQLLLEINQTVLITSHTHMAVDNICIRLKNIGISFLRLGDEGRIDPTVKSMSERALTRHCKTPQELEKVYNSANIVAVTCLGSKHSLLSKRTFDVCVVDESTQVLQCSIFRALLSSKKFILIGDPDQLAPVVRNREAIARGMSESLFERLQCPEAIVTLNYQYRMNKPLTALANALTYQGCLQPANESVRNATIRLVKSKNFLSEYSKRQWILQTLDDSLDSTVKVLDTGPTYNLKNSFLSLNEILLNDMEENKQFSCTNSFEAGIIISLVNALIKAEVSMKSIGIISPYRAQVRLISSLLQSKDVAVNTVDQFQGQDKDIIIYSCTKTKSSANNTSVSKFDILEDERRLTVAITRAKHKLILIGDVSTLRLYTTFSRLLNEINSHNFIRLIDGKLGFSWNAVRTEAFPE